MKKIRLGVNIDHVATVRNARGENYPNPLRAAVLAQINGADSVTIHLREDRRHINENDLKNIKSKIKIPLNLEIAATREMLKIALKRKPHLYVLCQKKKRDYNRRRVEFRLQKNFLKIIISKLKNNNSRVSLFVEPEIKTIKKAKVLGADCVEIHTGKLCNLINLNRNYKMNCVKLKTQH